MRITLEVINSSVCKVDTMYCYHDFFRPSVSCKSVTQGQKDSINLHVLKRSTVFTNQMIDIVTILRVTHSALQYAHTNA